MPSLLFEWDPRRDAANEQKHGATDIHNLIVDLKEGRAQ